MAGMSARHRLATGGLALAIACGGAVSGGLARPAAAATAPNAVLLPPSGGRVYHAAFPDFGGPEDRVSAARIHSFERLAGRRITWAYFSNNWTQGRVRFPTGRVGVISRAGRVPFIRMMARSGWARGGDPHFPLRSIVSGAWDPDLREWCGRARDTGLPLLVEFGTEVNGDWFPWNGRWNGAGRRGGYGDPTRADGPERFRDAYRRIVDLCRDQGADNITWFFHVDVGGWPRRPWNRIAGYWPGDAYVDWIGVSDYGPQEPGEQWVSFRRRLDRAYPRIAALSASAPIAVLEYGATEDPEHPAAKPRWIRKAIRDVAADRWPRVAALSYWHENWRNPDGSTSALRLDSSPRVERAYRRGVSRHVFTSRVRFGERGAERPGLSRPPGWLAPRPRSAGTSRDRREPAEPATARTARPEGPASGARTAGRSSPG